VVILIIGLIILIAAFIQGLTSFGASLIALPLLTFFLPINVVVPMLITYNFVMNANLFYHLRKGSNIKRLLPLVITAGIFTILGGFFLKEVDPKYVKWVIGSILIFMSVTKTFGLSFSLKKPEKAFIPVGVVSGLLNGMAGLSGPPVLIFLSSINISKQEFRATLSTYFVILNVISISTFAMNGLYNYEVFKNVLLYVPFLITGLYSGMFVSKRVNEENFKKVVLVLVGFFGLMMFR
jgi:uncharacterized membrane protein YfcA